MFNDNRKWETVASISKINSNITIVSDTQIGGSTSPPPSDDPEESDSNFDTRPLPSSILNRVHGFARVEKENIEKSSLIQSIIERIESSQERELSSANLIAVFEKIEGINFKYRLHHENGNMIYEAQVSYSFRNRKTFVESFGRIR